MSSPWTLVGNVVKLVDETNTVRVGPPVVGSSAPRLEVSGRIVATEAANLPLQDKGGNVFDVKAYGATGDGLADDLPAIHAAVAALRGAGGGTLYFPQGRFKVSNEIFLDGFIPPIGPPPDAGKPVPFLVRGAGPGVSTLVTGSPTAHTIRTSYGGAVGLGRELFMEIRDLSFGVAPGVSKTAGDAIRQECAPLFQNTFLVRNCWFKDVHNGVHLTAVGSAIIKDCQFLNPKNAAIFLEQTSLPPSADVGAVFIANNFFFRKPAGGSGVYGVFATTGASGVRLHHNAFVGLDHQVLLALVEQSQHTAVDIDNNVFDGNSANAKVQISGFGFLERLTISNNQFVVAQAAGPIAGLLVDVGRSPSNFSGVVSHGTITDNVFTGNPGQKVGKGLVLAPTDAAADCRDLLVSGNVFKNLATGIEVGQFTHRVFVSENVFGEGTVTTPAVIAPGATPRGAFFPDRIGVGRPNDVVTGGGGKEIYAFSDQPVRPRIYLQGKPAVSTPGIDFAFDNTNTQRAGIVGSAVGNGTQLELFTKPNGPEAVIQRAVLDPGGNLLWKTPNFTEMIELGADPSAPAADKARLFLRDNGAGKTQLCVLFATGAVQVLATQT